MSLSISTPGQKGFYVLPCCSYINIHLQEDDDKEDECIKESLMLWQSFPGCQTYIPMHNRTHKKIKRK